MSSRLNTAPAWSQQAGHDAPGGGACAALGLDRFAPDPSRAERLDRHARHALRDSLERVFAACTGILPRDEAGEAALLDSLAAGGGQPGLFAIYAELVEALYAGEFLAAEWLLAVLMRPALRAPVRRCVVGLADAALGGEGMADAYRRVIDDDPTQPTALVALPPAALAQAAAQVEAALALVAAAAPALAGEIAAVAPQIVVVESDPPGRFDGASTFYLWGAVALRAVGKSRVELAEALAHEAGHAYLLGATQGAPLVLNDPAQRFASPLRSDPRPMDGLVHAGFVLARMVWCQQALLASDALHVAERGIVELAKRRNAARFHDAASVIGAHARFTPDGAVLWRAATGFMARRTARFAATSPAIAAGIPSMNAAFCLES